MGENPNIAKLVTLLGEPSRAIILTSLMDGRFYTASELAYLAGIQPQTASFHLAKMMDAQLIKVERHGRHRYYQLISHEVAETIETLHSISPPPEIKSLRQSSKLQNLRHARICYDHLAGNLGVKLAQSMVELQIIEQGETEYMITSSGEHFFSDWGVDLSKVRSLRRSFSRACLDWSERQHHLAGALGCAIASYLFDLGWIVRTSQSRAIKVTEDGIVGFKKHFKLDLG